MSGNCGLSGIFHESSLALFDWDLLECPYETLVCLVAGFVVPCQCHAAGGFQYDPKRLFAMIRERQAAAAARGVVFIPEPKRRAAVREDADPYCDQPGKDTPP